METTAQPQAFTPKTVSVMGVGEEIRNIETLKRFHTPSEKDGGTRDYHTHTNLTSHYDFAQTILEFANANGIEIDDVAFKVDKVTKETLETKNFFGSVTSSTEVTIAQRFFMIARIKNPEYQLADDVETFIIARNSHDKRLPMEVAIGNKVIVCSNLMFGGDIAIKAKNTPLGYTNLTERLCDLFHTYTEDAEKLKEDIKFFKRTHILEKSALAFIAHHASSGKFIQPSRTAAVCDMFIAPEHREQYQDDEGYESYTLWRLLNAYTYVHRGDLVINPETGTHYPDERRTNVCSLELKKAFTKELWDKLANVTPYGKWYRKDA